MQNFIELLKDHTLILAAGKSLAEITKSSEPQPEAAFDALGRLTRQLETHLRAEDAFLSQDRATGYPEFAALALEHGERFEELVQEWTLYLATWTMETIRADWAGFGHASRRIVVCLEEQVEAENVSLYPAALKYGLIRLLPEKTQAVRG